MTNKVIATIPIGQTSQALVYVPDASPNENADNLVPLGEVRETGKIEMLAASGRPHLMPARLSA